MVCYNGGGNENEIDDSDSGPHDGDDGKYGVNDGSKNTPPTPDPKYNNAAQPARAP